MLPVEWLPGAKMVPFGSKLVREQRGPFPNSSGLRAVREAMDNRFVHPRYTHLTHIGV
jgi:hypothetical protein